MQLSNAESSTVLDDPGLDNPVLGSLAGRHRGLAIGDARAVRYPGEVSPFMAIADDADAEDWVALARLAAPGPVMILDTTTAVPPSWRLVHRFDGLQMVGPVGDALHDASILARTAGDLQLVRLGSGDVPAMLDLAGRTKPGPFLPRTVELGVYFGVRDGDRLVAMAGERLQPPGWSEISGVCSDPDYRGRGLARLLVETVADEIRARGARPFLHVVEGNDTAIRLYRSMGFTTRRGLTISSYQPESR
ncbi:GNAT family N-acetyltransferase [Microlunatus endophyticus]|uniref:GNAT family N-acetyltransferase n=1 Tax=Microlunatus endophyticus TaxID=1716077 RepID=A0A917S6S5_9ACTN|nr:GNAT family N-acetyltransferase [Microlunatus endophyticus]GGL57642.1 GNAT family N-acetyltransferase [Microlunatus endophyticus]